MSRGIVVGVSWYDNTSDHRIERVAAGPDAKIRQVIDKVVAAAPENIRRDVARFLAPLLEGNEPPRAGMYGSSGIVWWKRTYIEET